MKLIMLSKEEIEQKEYHYFNTIFFLLEQDMNEMIKGLDSKNKIKDDWKEVFFKNNKNQASDFAKGIERIYFGLLNQFGKPNSTPIGSDLMFETYDAFIHIDIKTCRKSNTSDYLNKIPVGQNQSSYKDRSFQSKLPTYYQIKDEKKVEKKICLTYILSIVYNHLNLSIISVELICVPNGELAKVYKDRIVGREKVQGISFRFIHKNSKFQCVVNNPARHRYIFKSSDPSEFVESERHNYSQIFQNN